MTMNKLTAKQEAFVREYLVDLNATQAAIRAGYKQANAHQTGYENLRKPEIVSAIQTSMDNRAKEVGLSAEKVLKDIDLVKADAMRSFLDKDGNEAMNNHAAALKALELQGRHLKMFTDKIEVDLGADLATKMKEARERSQQA
jgi:phage terminase small subunit